MCIWQFSRNCWRILGFRLFLSWPSAHVAASLVGATRNTPATHLPNSWTGIYHFDSSFNTWYSTFSKRSSHSLFQWLDHGELLAPNGRDVWPEDVSRPGTPANLQHDVRCRRKNGNLTMSMWVAHQHQSPLQQGVTTGRTTGCTTASTTG